MPSPGWVMPLFVPANRPERFAKAANSGADAIIIDLEDAVAPEEKDSARQILQNIAQANSLETLNGIDIIVRINAADSQWHAQDLECVKSLPIQAVMLPKADSAKMVETVHATTGHAIIALIETAPALSQIDEIANANGTVQLAFGTMDLSSLLACAPDSKLFDVVRLHLLVASVEAKIFAPLDGVSTNINETSLLERDARAIAANGFSGRLLIHPAQIGPTAIGLTPTAEEIEQSTLIAAAPDGASRISGLMVDAPVRLGAERILTRATRLKTALRTLNIKD